MSKDTQTIKFFVRALKQWGVHACSKPLQVLETREHVHVRLCGQAMRSLVNYAWMDIRELESLPPGRVCVECVTAGARDSGSPSDRPKTRPSPFLPVLLAAKENLSAEDKARLLLAAAPSPEVPMEDISAIVAAHATSEQDVHPEGWLMFARTWSYYPMDVPQYLRKWLAMGWHDTRSNWSILPVVDTRPGAIKSLAPARAVHDAVRVSQRWPHTGRHGITRALSGHLWSTFSALEPYRPLWLDAQAGAAGKRMRDVFEAFMVISDLDSHVNSPELADLWKASHALT